MNAKFVNVATAILFSFGLLGCSSGGSDSPGISVEESQQRNAVKNIQTAQTSAQTELMNAQQALQTAQTALQAVQQATTLEVLNTANSDFNAALDKMNKASSEVSRLLRSAQENVAKASVVLPTAQAEVDKVAEIAAQVQRLSAQMPELASSFNQTLEKAKVNLAEVERIANLTQQMNNQLANIQKQLEQAQAAQAKAESATTSAEAIAAAQDAEAAFNQALIAQENLQALAQQAGENAPQIANLTAQAAALVQSAKAASESASQIATELLTKEEGIAKEEAAKLIKANNDAAIAKNSAETQLALAEKAAVTLASAATQVHQNSATKLANSALGEVNSQLAVLQNAQKTVALAIENAKSTASISSSAQADVRRAEADLAKISALVAQAESASQQANQYVQNLVVQDKRATTRYSYEHADSVVRDYEDSITRDKLLAEIKQRTNVVSGEICATGSAQNPGKCFAGGTIGSGSRKGENVEGKAKGTVLLSNAQAYSGYAVIREEHSSLTPENNTGDANAFVALANSADVVKDKALVTDATYRGTASYSTNGRANVTTNNLVMTVKDEGISGYIYRTSTTGSGKTNTRTFAYLKEAEIALKDGAVGFNGEAVLNPSPKQVDGTVPTVASLENASKVDGTYQGVFVGPQANEVVGTFETNSDVKESMRGAFVGAK